MAAPRLRSQILLLLVAALGLARRDVLQSALRDSAEGDSPRSADAASGLAMNGASIQRLLVDLKVRFVMQTWQFVKRLASHDPARR